MGNLNKCIGAGVCLVLSGGSAGLILSGEKETPKENSLLIENNETFDEVELVSNEEEEEENVEWDKPSKSWNSSKDIKTNYKKDACLRTNFNGSINWNQLTFWERLMIMVNDVKTTDAESCLVVNWTKQTYRKNKWWGEFKLVWSISNNTAGIMVVVHAVTENGSLMVDTSSYVLQRTGRNSWNAKLSQENEPRKATSSDLQDLIPRSGSLVKKFDGGIKPYWGFEPNLDEICDDKKCGAKVGEAVKSFTSWKFRESKDTRATYDIESLFENIKKWFDTNFKDWKGWLLDPILNKQIKYEFANKSGSQNASI